MYVKNMSHLLLEHFNVLIYILNQTVYSMSSFPCQASSLKLCTHLCIDFYDLLKKCL